MTSESDLVQQGRTAIDTVAQRVKSDPQYAERFKEEPVALLLEAGAPAEGMVDILRETGFSSEDVSGFIMGIGISAPKLSTGQLGAPQPGLASGPGGLAGGGGLMDCSGTCNCSSSCLFTF